MIRQGPIRRAVVAAALMGEFLTTLALSAQTPPAKAPGTGSAPEYRAARTPDGQPDIQGFWQINGIGIAALEVGGYRGGIDAFIPDDRPNRPRPSVPAGIIDPPGGRLPLQPWAAARMKEQGEYNLDPKGRLDRLDPMARCLPAGVPRFNYSTGYNGYQFLQTAGYVTMVGEWNHHHRFIPVDGRPHLPQGIRLWMGDARGRWEGQTLIIDTANFQGENWLDMVGAFHSEALRVVERYRIVDGDTIAYEATIDDPKVYTQPWKLAGWFNRAAKGYQLFEYACQEGNKFLEFLRKPPG
jgi:hypothetical protein